MWDSLLQSKSQSGSTDCITIDVAKWCVFEPHPISDPHHLPPRVNYFAYAFISCPLIHVSDQISSRLDSIGKGCFAHDFGSLDDDHNPIIEAFESVGAAKPSLALMTIHLLGPQFPSLATRLPNETTNALKRLCKTMKENAEQLLTNVRKEKVMNSQCVDRSILGAFGPLRIPLNLRC